MRFCCYLEEVLLAVLPPVLSVFSQSVRLLIKTWKNGKERLKQKRRGMKPIFPTYLQSECEKHRNCELKWRICFYLTGRPLKFLYQFINANLSLYILVNYVIRISFTLSLSLMWAFLQSTFRTSRRSFNISAMVITDTPIQRPNWPPMSLIKFSIK